MEQTVAPPSLVGGAESEGVPHPFVVVAEPSGSRFLVPLASGRERLTVGRRSAADVALTTDPEVSRLHAELVRVESEWTVVDDGLSANGTFVNGQRLHGRRRLRDGDRLRLGQTTIVFRQPRPTKTPATVQGRWPPQGVHVSDIQRRILIALCRPFRDGAAFAIPASNEEIAGEVFLSVDAVKKHLRALSARFDVGRLPAYEKRVRLVERVLASGVISPHEL
jgi:pSer/pThr/pTyr-binding forkhead associated (FHA) protein